MADDLLTTLARLSTAGQKLTQAAQVLRTTGGRIQETLTEQPTQGAPLILEGLVGASQGLDALQEGVKQAEGLTREGVGILMEILGPRRGPPPPCSTPPGV